MTSAIKTGFILGAGASLPAGYPLAKDIPAAIESFVVRIAERPDCDELQAWCKGTLELMRHENCLTLDELAFACRQRDGGRAVLQAKAVMTALFLDLERNADLTPYRRAAHQTMIDFDDLELRDEGDMHVPRSAFCICYNYDRCLEGAICHEIVASGCDQQHGYTSTDVEVSVQRLINSGLDTMHEHYEPIDTTRFSILKMHGLIGTLRKHNRVGGKPLCDFGKVAVSDELLGAFQQGHWRESPTMIFFPWEANDAPDWTRALIEKTDRAAETFLAGVEELKIVGYSFHDLNRRRFEKLLAKAQGCKVIDLYDPSEESWRRLQSLTSRLNIPAKRLWHKEGWQP